MVDRAVAGAVNGLVDELTVERKRVPGEVLFEADKLECLVFDEGLQRMPDANIFAKAQT
jgi:hypothetical protein